MKFYNRVYCGFDCMVEFTRRKLMATSAAAALGASVSGVASAERDPEDTNTPGAPSVKGQLERFATTALGAEVTGPEVTRGGSLFFSLQHPSRGNPAPFNLGDRARGREQLSASN